MNNPIELTPETLVTRLGDYLVDRGYISAEDLQRALERQTLLRTTTNAAPLLGQLLLEMGVIDRPVLDRAITEQILEYRTALQAANQQLENRVRERTAELEIALQKLAQLTQLKANFVSNISHELRTPLTHLKGYLELIANGDLGPINSDQSQATGVMTRATERLEHLIDDLILFSMMERGETSIRVKPFNLIAVCEAIASRYTQVALDKQISLSFDHPASFPSVMGDEEKVHWVIQQLVDNAVKFTGGGGSVHIIVEKEERLVTLTVRDTGIGIPQDRIQEVFQPFHQLDGSSTRRYAGTGLGLALAQVIVKSHGSEISIKSTVGRGSEFSFFLNAAEDVDKV